MVGQRDRASGEQSNTVEFHGGVASNAGGLRDEAAQAPGEGSHTVWRERRGDRKDV